MECQPFIERVRRTVWIINANRMFPMMHSDRLRRSENYIMWANHMFWTHFCPFRIKIKQKRFYARFIEDKADRQRHKYCLSGVWYMFASSIRSYLIFNFMFIFIFKILISKLSADRSNLNIFLKFHYAVEMIIRHDLLLNIILQHIRDVLFFF